VPGEASVSEETLPGSEPTMEIAGSVCIVTGASSGIGAATARLLSSLGAHVVLAARRGERLETLAGELPGSLAVTTDVTMAEQLDRLVTRTLGTFGRIDVLVNNAGQGLHVPLEELDPVDLRAVFELNVVAPLVGMQAVLPVMRAGSGGAIVNVSSATSLRVFPGLGGYSATKAALNMLSQVARVEFAPAGIAVSVVYPSVTATEFHQRLRAGHLVAGGRSITPDPPELVAQAIAMAISTGEPHVLVADPPKAIVPGDSEGWGALLARQAPRAAGSSEQSGSSPA
jgi:NAD(P)-dependent dehydrogenase (short-subunit alcohol dehydrogenase family)